LSSVSDGYSPVTIKYCVDTTNTCSPLTTYLTQITISSEGTNYLRYQAVDEAGNVETIVNEKIVKMDKTTPITSDDYVDGWHNSLFNITLTASNDSLSPVTTYYKIWEISESQPTTWTEGNLISVDSDGEYNIKYYSEDEADNIEEESDILVVQLDTTEPVVTIDEVTTPTNSKTQIITGTFTETNINSITVNGVPADLDENTYSAEITLETEGNNSILVIATDEASNSINVSSWIVLDTTSPTINIALPATNGTVIDQMDYYRFEADADDSLSGIKNVKLTLRDSLGNVVDDLENVLMSNGTSNYEYMMNMWQLESGDYYLIINATDEAGNYAYDVRSFVIQDNVAASRIRTINGIVSAETGGIVTFRFNVTARGEDGIKFGMGNVGAFSPSALNARISENETTFAKVGGWNGVEIINAETLELTDLDTSTPNVQGSFVLYLDVPANMTPGTYPITYYINN
ncbi:MAG: Ig-like domain-containing protein, partial [Candidatus Pacearchaeota archaeon]